MSMSAGGNEGGVVAEINVTPLVDVMLVLLIIFMITAPLMSHRVKIELPKAQQERNVEPPGTITLSLHSTGEVYWNDVETTKTFLNAQLRVEARKTPQPELQLRADKDTEYRLIVDVMAEAKAAGMKKIDMITTPH